MGSLPSGSRRVHFLLAEPPLCMLEAIGSVTTGQGEVARTSATKRRACRSITTRTRKAKPMT